MSQLPSRPPASYASLPTQDIRLAHHPPSAPTATPIVILSLHRPKAHNAFTATMLSELSTMFSLFSLDDRIKCIIVTGTGRMFCAGADLTLGFKQSEGIGEPDPARKHRDGGGQVALAIHGCMKPVIAAVQGPAVGVGITMTLPMTIRVALASAKVAFPFTRLGLVPEAASSLFLPRLIGHGRAMHVCSTGGTYRADDKLLDGLFTEFRDTPEQVVSRAIEVAEDIVQNTSIMAWKVMREMLWRGPDNAEETHLLDSKLMGELRGSKDNDEGVSAFMKRRRPAFKATLAKDAPAAYPWWRPIDVKVPGSGRPKL